MAYLFPLALRGVGTCDIEGLDSYILRLARCHGVSPIYLLKTVLERHPATATRLTTTVAYVFSGDLLVTAVRPNFTTQDIVVALENATGRHDLRSATFLALQSALHRSMRTFSRRFRWCPGCFREFNASGEEAYFKLIWRLNAVNHCHIHGLPLEDCCPQCGAHQNRMKLPSALQFCQKCGKYLSADVELCDKSIVRKPHDKDLEELVNEISTNHAQDYPRDGVQKVLIELFDRAWQNGQEDELWASCPRDEYLALIHGHKPVTLQTSRRLAFHFGMSLVDLLSGRIDTSSKVLNPEWTAALPLEMKPRKRPRPRNREVMLDKLMAVLSNYDGKEAPPLKKVASDMEVSVGCLQYHFPVVCKEVVQRYKQRIEDTKKRMEAHAKQAVLAFFVRPKYDEYSKSKKNALRVIRAETGLPKNVLRRAINEVLDTL